MAKFWPEHQLLQVDGATAGGDVWSFSLRTMWGPAPGLPMSFEDQETALKSTEDPPGIGLWSVVQDYWTQTAHTAAHFCNNFSLVGVKFNSIDSTGHYRYPDTSEFLYSPAIPGILNAGGDPRQSIVVTLRADYDRGRGSFGRFFPPNQGPSISAGFSTISSSQQADCANAALDFIRAINAMTVSGDALTVVNVSPGDDVAGTSAVIEPVTRVQVDQVVDTQRRRTNAIDGKRATYPVAV